MSKTDNKELLSETGVMASGNRRYRFAVPETDSQVNDWIDCQSNLGFSIRVLIKAYIAMLGMTDATCTMNIVVPRKGRPPKTDAEKLLKAFQKPTDADTAYAMDSDSSLDMFKDNIPSNMISNEMQSDIPKDLQTLHTLNTNTSNMEPNSVPDKTDVVPKQTSSSGVVAQSVDPMLQMMSHNTAPTAALSQDDDGFVDTDSLFG